MTRMVAWNFVTLDREGKERAVTFYARTEAEARKLAAAWGKRTGQEVRPLPDEGGKEA